MEPQKREDTLYQHIYNNYKKLYEAVLSPDEQKLERLLEKLKLKMGLKELECVISKVFSELKFNNIQVPDLILLSLERILLQIRFSCNDSKNTVQFSDIESRILLIVEFIEDLHSNIDNSEIFVAILTFIAKHVHVLKTLLKSTYDRLPWEEIEFCVLCFIHSSKTHHDSNIFNAATLNKQDLLKYLNSFSSKLVKLGADICNLGVVELSKIPKLKREEVIEKILVSSPEFEGLYIDYEHIRDIHSLSLISEYVELVNNAVPKEKNGQNIIIRTLQMIGEHLKNTLESPKLSKGTSDLLLLSLQKNTRGIVMNLRDSLSHAKSLSRRLELQENQDLDYFTGIKADIKRIGRVTEHILLKNKVQLIRELGNQLIECEDIEKIKEIASTFKNLKFMDHLRNFRCRSDISEIEQLKSLVEEMNKNVSKESHIVKKMGQEMQQILQSAQCLRHDEEDLKMNLSGCSMENLALLIEYFSENSTSNERYILDNLKFHAKNALGNITPKVELQNMERIAEIAILIQRHSKSDDIHRLMNEIFHTVKFGLDRITWAEKFQKKLKQRHLDYEITETGKENQREIKISYRDQLNVKLKELGHILNHTSGKKRLTYSQFSTNRELKVAVEVLLLDIFSINTLIRESHQDNKIFFLDSEVPSLTGKNLRNHLAHNNVLINVLFNPTLSLFLNAERLNEEGIDFLNRNIGFIRKYDYSDLKKQYKDIIEIVCRKQKMFSALKAGDFENFTTLVSEGAEIRAKDCVMSTCLHYAAENSSVETFEYLYNQELNLNVKNVQFRTPLHIAASKGNKGIVEFILKISADCINDIDQSERTALHCAAYNGHEPTVRILIKHKANLDMRCSMYLTPLHHAVLGGSIRAIKILMENYIGQSLPSTVGGKTVLHLASENGSAKVIQFLITKNVNVNAKEDKGATPLVYAAYYGHLEVVNVLVKNGADVNDVCVNGDSPLYYATRYNFEHIVNILLEHGANVNITDLEGHYTPLHATVMHGNVSIARNLLRHGAKVNAVTIAGFTPLHFAVQTGHTELVSLFLQQKEVDANVKCRRNCSPLQNAAEKGEAKIAKLLIEKGAKLYDKSDFKSALYFAAAKGNEAIVDLLIKNGAPVNSKNSDGSVPLHGAVRSGIVSIIKLLIENEADLNAKTSNESNCLHIAARNGVDVVSFLVQEGVDINAKTRQGYTSLHEASIRNHQNVVTSLIENGADIDAVDSKGYTALHIAAAAGYKNILEMLFQNNADISIENEDGESPLFVAVRGNQKEIVEFLISNNAKYSYEKCLFHAVLQGYTSILEVLLNHRPRSLLEKTCEGTSLLHVAVNFGQIDVVELLLKKGADPNIKNSSKGSPLFSAAKKGFHEIAELLIGSGANVNSTNDEGLTALHAVAKYGNFDIAQMLIKQGAKSYVLCDTNRLPIEFAASEGHLPIFKLLLSHENIDINRKGNADFTMLHIAAQFGRSEIVKYLIEKGADVNERNTSNSKPIHIAAREGFLDIVDVFLQNGIDIDDRGICGNTLLHYASSSGKVEVMKYLLDKGHQVNNANFEGQTSLHIACSVSNKDSVEFLLNAGAIYNISDVHNNNPIQYCYNDQICKTFISLNELFDCIKFNKVNEIEKVIKEGAIVNVQHTEMISPLHYATYKNRESIVRLLLQNKASVNSISRKGWTVLHYAAKFSDLKIVKMLLAHGAKYNAVSDTGKTPLEFTRNCGIKSLLKLIGELFDGIRKGNTKIVELLKNVEGAETIKAVMNAQNMKGQTIMICAIQSNFPETEELKWIGQQDLIGEVPFINFYITQEKYDKALQILEKIQKRRCDVFGKNNIITLEIQVNIADTVCKLQNYQQAVVICREVYRKQVQLLGVDSEQALKTNSMLGLALYRLGENEEARNILEDTLKKQKQTMGEEHGDSFRTQCHLALVLNSLEKFEEALEVNKISLEISKKLFGISDLRTVMIQNNMANVFSNMGQYAQASQIYDEVYNNRKQNLGEYHSDTLRALYNKAALLEIQEKYDEALIAFEQIHDDQKHHLGLNHIDTLNTCHHIGQILLAQGKTYSAFKKFREVYDKKKMIFGEKHPEVVRSSIAMKFISESMKLKGMPIEINDFLENLQISMSTACSVGDLETVQNLLKSGIEINEKDSNGRTALYFAVNGAHTKIINLLLLKGANVTDKTNKGNTTLHTACSRDSKEIVNMLLNHVEKDKLHQFINAQTNIGKQTALHIAAEKGNSDIVELLLENGAMYNSRNKNGQTPRNSTQNQRVIEILDLIEAVFRFGDKGNINAMMVMLNELSKERFVCVMNAHNLEGCTLLQILIGRRATEAARTLLMKLKLNNV